MTAALGRADLSIRLQRLLLALAAVTALTEVVALLGFLPAIEVGVFNLSPSLIPALLLMAVLGGRLVGRTYDVHAEAVFWAAAVIGLGAVMTQFVVIGQASTVPAILGAAIDEELVYRLAIPLIITAALAGWGLRADRARIVGFVVAGLWFAALPGHRAQMGNLAEALPFLAFATLAALVVYRSGGVLAVIAIHACTDFFNLLAMQHRIGPLPRALGLAALFLLLVMAYGVQKPRRRPVRSEAPAGPEPDVIDLRDHVAEPAAPAAPEPVPGPPSDPGAGDEHLPVA